MDKIKERFVLCEYKKGTTIRDLIRDRTVHTQHKDVLVFHIKHCSRFSKNEYFLETSSRPHVYRLFLYSRWQPHIQEKMYVCNVTSLPDKKGNSLVCRCFKTKSKPADCRILVLVFSYAISNSCTRSHEWFENSRITHYLSVHATNIIPVKIDKRRWSLCWRS